MLDVLTCLAASKFEIDNPAFNVKTFYTKAMVRNVNNNNNE